MHSRMLNTFFNAVPSQVTSLHVDLSSRTVTWVLPQHSSDVTMYQLQFTPLCSNDTLITDHDNTTNTSIDLPDIDQTVPYNITMKAVNNIGPGQQKNITVKRIDTESKRNFVSISILNFVYTVPASAPENVTVSHVGDSVIWVSWREADCRLHHSQSLKYVMLVTMIGRGSNYTYIIPLSQSSRMLTGLSSLTEYSIQMALRNNLGQGPYSDQINVTTLMSTSGNLDIETLKPRFVHTFIRKLKR